MVTEPAPGRRPPSAATLPAAPPPGATPHVIRGLARWPATLAWRLVRPVVRPLMWRFRTFMTAEVMRELADVRTRQEAMLNGAGGGGMDPKLIEAMERVLLTFALEDGGNPAPAGLPKPSPPG